MPRLVSDLDKEELSYITGLHFVLVVDPTNDDIVRIPAADFRGAGVFTSNLDPAPVPENPDIPSYMAGDLFLKTSPEGEYLYKYDGENNVWEEDSVKLNGTRVLSARDFVEEINLDYREESFTDPSVYVGDYYLNRTANILFGSYNDTFGFQFGGVDFQGYTAYRTQRTFEYQGKDALGYEKPSLYWTEFRDNADPLNVEALVRRYPEDGDTVHITLEDDEGHGGWVWIIDRSNANPLVNSSNTLEVNYDGLCGVLERPDLVTGDPTIVTQKRTHAREAATFNVTTTPVQNNKKYRQGDNVFDVEAGILYYGYIESDTTITSTGDLFEGQTVLAGTSILNTYDDASDSWSAPVKDDAKYKTGDFILTKDLETPRIHGSYMFDADSNREAWSLYTVLRTPVDHKIDLSNNEVLALTYSGDYPVWDGTMIVEDDYILDYYSATKQYRRKVTAIGYDKDDATKRTITLDTNRIPNHPVRITQVQDVGIPSIDDSKYYDGEIIRNKVGDLFQYDESFDPAVDSEMVSIPSLKPTQSYRVPDTGYAAFPVTPSRKQEDVQWGSSVIQDGDQLVIHYSASKAVVYTAEVNEALAVDPANDSITWNDERNLYPKAHYEFDSEWGDPTVDQTKYSDEDTCTTADGRFWSYDEDADSGNGAWEFVRWVRPQKTFDVSLSNTWKPSDGVVGDLIPLDGQAQHLRTGDIIINTISGTTKNKKKQFIVTQGYPYGTGEELTFTDAINPNGVRYFSEPTTNTGHPNLNDADYTTGDFIDSSSTEKRYIYVEEKATNTEAWLEFIPLNSATLTDATTTTEYTLTVDDGEFYFLEV